MKPVSEVITIQLTNRTGEPKVSVPATVLPASPHFAIHPEYLGNNNFSEKFWRITHIQSGMGFGHAFKGKKAHTAMRCVAAVLERMPVDWSKQTITFDDFKAIPDDIFRWRGEVMASI